MIIDFRGFISLTLIAFIIFIVLDLVWLGFIAKDFYRKQLKSRLNPSPNKIVTGLFYLLFVVGLVHFAISPAVIEQDYKVAFFNGGLYGFFTYMTYELTNFAVLKNWPTKLVLVDITWGTFLSLNVSSMAYLLYNIIQ